MIYIISLLIGLQTAIAFDWQGHRGARGLYPENTIGAMKEALKYPAITTLELDVVVSKDGEVVVSHEPWMGEEFCLNPQGKTVKEKEVNLYKLTYAEISKYDCGSKKHPRFPEQKRVKETKPKLAELLKALKSSGKNFSIEIKSTVEGEKTGYQPDYKAFTDKVLTVIKKNISLDKVMLQCFDWRVLEYVHKKEPTLRLVALREEPYDAKTILNSLSFRPTIFAPDYQLLKAEDIKEFKKMGVLVIPWTVSTKDEMIKLIKMGVDGIITDYPNRIPAKL